MNERHNVRVLVFPADDAALRAEVESSLERIADRGADGDSAEALRTELRPWYRSVTVHVRDAFGGYDGDPVPTWYVYRDGRVRPRNEGLDRLYRAMAVARDTCRSSATAIAASYSVAELAGYGEPPPREAVRGSRRRTAAPRDRV
jgi:hypothetical protein